MNVRCSVKKKELAENSFIDVTTIMCNAFQSRVSTYIYVGSI